VHVPLGGTRRGGDRDEREQVLRGIEGKSGDLKVKRERPAMRFEPAQLGRELEYGERAPVFGEIYGDAVRELRHHSARDVDFVVRGPGEVPPGVGVLT
jgi:hypothetical protein